MIFKYFSWLFLFLCGTHSTSQTMESGLPVEGELVVIDKYETEQGYYVFAPVESDRRQSTPVVFVHGYGALNPMIYGGWIRHLTNAGHVVIFPRYQKGLLGTSADDFVPFTAEAIRNAMTDARGKGIELDDKLYLIGHSYGGVIIANLAARWKELSLPQPGIALLCEPGSGPLRGGVLDAYDGISEKTSLVVVVGDDDQTVGQQFGEFVFNSSVNATARAFLWQYACASDTLSVSASHYEPYSLDAGFDNGIENFTSKRASRLATTDRVDTNGYWKIFDMLVARARSSASGPFTERELDIFSDLGLWPDGSALTKMEYRLPVGGR